MANPAPRKSRQKGRGSNPSSSNTILVGHLLKWFREAARDLPWRKTTDPYAIWVSEIMLQQTQVKTVIPYWQRWMRELPTVEALAAAPIQRLHKLWEGLGYYTRVRNFKKAAQQVSQLHGGVVPSDVDQLLQLPGIGRYTAGAIASIAFNQAAPILDGNVVRVLTRFYAIRSDVTLDTTKAQLWQLADQAVSEAAATGLPRACGSLNQALMELGALICMPRNPLCPQCPLSDHCLARARNIADQLPRKSKRIAVSRKRHLGFICLRKNKVFVQLRPSGVVNAHLWEFPTIDVAEAAVPEAEAHRFFGKANLELQPFATVQHSITRYRIRLESFLVKGLSGFNQTNGQWISVDEAKQLPFSSAQKKILTLLAAKLEASP